MDLRIMIITPAHTVFELLAFYVATYHVANNTIRYKNKTKCICLECGHTWYLGEDDNKSQEV